MTTASRKDIEDYLERAKEKGATHLIVGRDTFSNDNYPVFVMPGQDAKEKWDEMIQQNYTSVNEVYNMSKDLESQLNEERAMNF